MKNILIKFKDEEIGNEMVKFTYDENKYNFYEIWDFASGFLYLDFDCYSSYEELKEDNPQLTELTKKIHDIGMEVLADGNYGVTTDRFCDFLYKAFNFNYEYVEAENIFDVEYGNWIRNNQ